MIKILNPSQVKQLDQYTIEQEPITSIQLMERASRAFTDWVIQHYDPTKKIGIVCGTGNNGGDGLGIARKLLENQYSVHVWVIRGGANQTEDFKINLEKAKSSKVKITEINEPFDQGLFYKSDILIDAIFGTGLSRSVEGIYGQVIQSINSTHAIKISVDIPSGLMADRVSIGEIVRAHRTLSFQLPKLSFFLPDCNQYVGEWSLLDIGLNKQFLSTVDTKHLLISKKSVIKKVRPRHRFTHKGNYGHALLIAGSYGKMGACILSARAALRSGIGLLTVHIPKSGNTIIQTSVAEAMSSVDMNENYFSSSLVNLNYTAIGIGPGIGQNQETGHAFAFLLQKYRNPMIIDADALNLLAENHQLLSLIPEGSILTPHPKEFERLVGSWKNDFERLELQRNLSVQTKTIVILKGAFTSIASPDGAVHFNPTGNPGMATGGSGDILTGVLTSLLAQGYSPLDTAILGVFIHGLSGDLAVKELGESSLIASDLIDYLPRAFRDLR